VDEAQLATLQSSQNTLTEIQINAIRQAYSDAFDEDMRVCAIVACIAALVSVGAWRRNRPTIQERNIQHAKDEAERRKAVKTQHEVAAPESA
jgi:hypothetical protein